MLAEQEKNMKRMVHTTRFLALMTTMVALLSCCQRQAREAGEGGKTPQPASFSGVKFKVGYSCYSLASPWMGSYKKAFEEELKNHPGFDVTWFDGHSDNKAVAAAIERWISRKNDLVISSSLDHVPLRTAYGNAKRAGIPILLTGNPPDYRVVEYVSAFSGLSEWEAGRVTAELLHTALGGSGQIAAITGPRGSASEQQATEGFKAALQRLASKVEIVATADGRWDVTVAYQKALDILVRFPGIDGFYAADDTIGSAVIRALKQKGYTPGQVKVVAQGGRGTAIADLKEGWYLGIVNQDPVLCARQDIWLMKALLEEHRQLPSFVQVRQEMITKENVAEFPGW
jgi:ribose transport system substrate-binding protein